MAKLRRVGLTAITSNVEDKENALEKAKKFIVNWPSYPTLLGDI